MQLGFLVFSVTQPDAWSHLFENVLGLQSTGGNRWRLDGYAWRLATEPGERDDLAAVGWLFEDAELDAALERLAAAGHIFTEVDGSPRSVRRRFVGVDPSGVPTELVSGLERADTPYSSDHVQRGFVAEEQGLGHVVLSTRDKAASVAFYTGLLGFRLSDHIVTEVYGHPVNLSFFHSNPRHHTVALGGPLPHRLHHFMLEVNHIDDLGQCYDRAIGGGIKIAQTLGRHPNDRMLSYYAHTPGGFQFEYGWGGRRIDGDDWTPTTYDCISEWGHHPPQIAFRKRSS